MPKVNKASSPDPAPNTEKKAVNKGLLVGAAVIIIIILASLIYFNTDRNGQPDIIANENSANDKKQQEQDDFSTQDTGNTITDEEIVQAAEADGEALNRLANVMLDGYYKDKEAWCEAAYEKADTRQHLYYVYSDEVDRLNKKYAPYEIVFEADIAIVGTFIDECGELGYELE